MVEPLARGRDPMRGRLFDPALANIDSVLTRTRLEGRDFSVVVSAEDVVHGKPDPEVFLTAAKRLHLEPKRSVVFEDAHVGIEAAHAAGMDVIAVTTTHSLEELRAADLVVRRLDELSVAQVSALLSRGNPEPAPNE